MDSKGTYIVMAYIGMAYIVVAFIVMSYGHSYGLYSCDGSRVEKGTSIGCHRPTSRRVSRGSFCRTYIVMAYTVMAYIVMAYIVMAHIVMAGIVMAYILMSWPT